MTTDAIKTEPSEKPDKEAKEITFKCKYCGKVKPLGQIKITDRYFPPAAICSECERKLR
jgi:uncharacterized OB-fold protein